MGTLTNSGSSLTTGRKVVAAAGTAERLSTSGTRVSYVIITAETDNTNPVTVGGSGVIGALSTRVGTPLAPGDSITLPISQLSNVWVDVITNGEGVTYTAIHP